MMTAIAAAIVVQDYTVAETAPGDFDWSYVYNYKGSSAVAVGGSWILTAAHVADDPASGSLFIAGSTYTEQEIVYHPLCDMALIRYDRPFPGHYTLYTGSPVGLEVIIAGFGNTGTVFSDHWTMGTTGRSTIRWGSQRIDRTRINWYDAEGNVGITQNYGFWMDFDLGNTSHETGTASGDSGSGVFFNDGETWKLAGFCSSVSGSGGQFDSTFSMSMSYYYDWIADTITAVPSDDADGDGLTNLQEETLGTNPMSSDTDSDLISDPLELINGLDPLVSNAGVDSDAEGLSDVDEVTILGTDPLHFDTDRDGLSDSSEVNTYASDPLLHDTDQDRLCDGTEVHTYSTQPTSADSDGDGTTDWEEIFTHGTDPTDPASDFDLDNDKMADIWEMDHFSSLEDGNPTNDPDGDFYMNLDEFRNDTDPHVFDTYVTVWPALELEWHAASGSVFQVQMSTNMPAGEWIDVGDPVIGDNTKHTLLMSTRASKRSMYRVTDAGTTVRLAKELEWNTAPGVLYQAQMSSNSISGIWHDIGSPVQGNGQKHYMLNSINPADNAVYRIQSITPDP